MTTAASGRPRPAILARNMATVLASCIAVWLLGGNLTTLDPLAIADAAAQFSVGLWAIGAALAAVSLAAVGGYDVLAARHLKVGVADREAFSAGWKATAVAQTVGFGLISGALVRWRVLGQHPDVNLWRTTQMTALVTGLFFGGWAVIASAAALAISGLPDLFRWLGLLGIWLTVSLVLLSIRLSHRSPKLLPPIRLVAKATGLAGIDTLAAVAIIYVFLPTGYAPFLMLYGAFLLAAALGMASGIPGGVGPFELSLIAVLSPADPTPLLAAILAYRAVYYMLPALLAGASLIAPGKLAPQVVYQPASHANAPLPAQAGLLVQGGIGVARSEAGILALGRSTLNTDIMFLDPVGQDTQADITARRRSARRQFRGLVLYKCSADTACAARAAGLSSLQIGSEAVLDVNSFHLDTPTRAQLRRKLRHAAKQGVTTVNTAPSLRQMRQLDADWQARNGRARGFSVGRFTPALVARQAVFTACVDDVPVSFVTFHTSGTRWVLDLVRSRSDCPDGTIHALVKAAIDEAKRQNVSQLSLCSAPLFLCDGPASRLGPIVAWAFRHSTAAKGLHRFKASFAPAWAPQYIAFDGYGSLLTGGADLYQLIHTPTPPPLDTRHTQPNNHYDDYEFASDWSPCKKRH